MPGERFILGNPDTSLEDDTTHFFGASCQDITGRTIPGGNHYVPGPDSCTVCLCDGGKPKWCQAVLCAAPKDCKSFRIGSSCCEFICLDNTEEGGRDEGSIDITWGDGNWVGGDLGLRLIATAVTAVLSLALLAFLFYRLRRRRVRRHSDCHEADATMMPSSSMASFEHGDLTSSTGHLSRQPQPMINNHQSPLYLMWKVPTTTVGNDNPPPYATRNDGRPLVDDERQESMGLLSVPTAPSEDLEDVAVVSVRRSNGTLNSEFLDAGTPPPSYAEVIASCSIQNLNHVITTSGGEDASGLHGDENEDATIQLRVGATGSLPRVRSPNAEAVLQRFSLQLALDCSDSSSCSSTSSQGARPISSSSSSSATSIAHIGSN